MEPETNKPVAQNAPPIPSSPDEQEAHAKRIKGVKNITTTAKVLEFATGIVTLGCMLFKQKNGLTIAENSFERMMENELWGKNLPLYYDRASSYLQSLVKNPRKFHEHEIPAPHEINQWKRLGHNALGGIATIFVPLSVVVKLGELAALKLYMRATKPEKQQER